MPVLNLPKNGYVIILKKNVWYIKAVSKVDKNNTASVANTATWRWLEFKPFLYNLYFIIKENDFWTKMGCHAF